MIRVCPKRYAVCPHGMKCSFKVDRYTRNRVARGCLRLRRTPPLDLPPGAVPGELLEKTPMPLTVKVAACVVSLLVIIYGDEDFDP